MTFAETDGRLEVTAEMTLEIRLFWIPVYEFSYRSREIWIDNSLTELTAQNIENDLEKSLSGQREGSNFLFKGPGEAGQIFGPVLSHQSLECGCFKAGHGIEHPYRQLEPGQHHRRRSGPGQNGSRARNRHALPI